MPIQILPARLANQIAAGEVVERPASVVKELIENSLDAGATRIEIEIEQGGAKCIRIKDNGSGVDKEQLTLALSRHATSKISHLDDLESISSLGFRGEALASISSVSRLTFTSKTAEQSEAWQAIAEGRDMQVNVRPAAHPQGTTVEVLDLFFNTPARRRFLKTEKTEFQHIDELIKRIALSRFDIAISLKHNHKIVRQYRIAAEQAQQEKRIAAICSEQFMAHAVYFEHSDQHLKISGWVSDRMSPRQLADVQYCYINGRMIRDKLVNHAIKQVYAHFLPQGMFPGYIIYIECDAREVDVNVHPAKHEVRFHQARWVHDFISSTLNSTLNESSLLSHEDDASYEAAQVGVPEHAYQPPVTPQLGGVAEEQAQSQQSAQRPPHTNVTYSSLPDRALQRPQLDQQQVGAYCDFVAEAYRQPLNSSSSLASSAHNNEQNEAIMLLALINEYYALVKLNNLAIGKEKSGIFVLSLIKAQAVVVAQNLLNAWQDGEVIAQPLLLPVRFKVDKQGQQVAETFSTQLQRLGFSYKIQNNFLIVKQVPAAFRHAPIAQMLPKVLTYLQESDQQESLNIAELCYLLAEMLMDKQEQTTQTDRELQQLLAQLQELSESQLNQCLQPADLSLLIKD